MHMYGWICVCVYLHMCMCVQVCAGMYILRVGVCVSVRVHTSLNVTENILTNC